MGKFSLVVFQKEFLSEVPLHPSANYNLLTDLIQIIIQHKVLASPIYNEQESLELSFFTINPNF